MTKRTGAERTRHVLLGAALLGPAVNAIGVLVRPGVDWADRAAAISIAVENSARWQLGNTLMIVGYLMLVPAAIATGHLIRRRKPALGLVGTSMLGTGAMLMAGWDVGDLKLAAAGGVDIAAVAQFSEQAESLSGPMALLSVAFLCVMGGMAVLAVGLWRARATPLWVPGVLAAGLLLNVLAMGGLVSAHIAAAAIALGFVGVALSHFSTAPQHEVRTEGAAGAHTAPTVA